MRGHVLETLEREKLEQLFEGIQPVRRGIDLMSALAWAIPGEEALRIRRNDIAVLDIKRTVSDSSPESYESRLSRVEAYGMPSFIIDLTRHYSTGETQVMSSAWFTRQRHGTILEHIDEASGNFHFFDEQELSPDSEPNEIFAAYDTYRKDNVCAFGQTGRKYALNVRPSIYTAEGVAKLAEELSQVPVLH